MMTTRPMRLSRSSLRARRRSRQAKRRLSLKRSRSCGESVRLARAPMRARPSARAAARRGPTTARGERYRLGRAGPCGRMRASTRPSAPRCRRPVHTRGRCALQEGPEEAAKRREEEEAAQRQELFAKEQERRRRKSAKKIQKAVRGWIRRKKRGPRYSAWDEWEERMIDVCLPARAHTHTHSHVHHRALTAQRV